MYSRPVGNSEGSPLNMQIPRQRPLLPEPMKMSFCELLRSRKYEITCWRNIRQRHRSAAGIPRMTHFQAQRDASQRKAGEYHQGTGIEGLCGLRGRFPSDASLAETLPPKM